jgi:hypothetical protein
MSLLPVMSAHQLPLCPPQRRWLIEPLWMNDAVGIVGGEPKCTKSFLALHMAVAVASGTPCLRRYAVAAPGRVLLYAAEDALHVVRQRLEGIARATHLELHSLDIQVITAPSLRIDVADDCRRLARTVAHLEPRLLILDPFIRLARIDENVSHQVAPVLAFLRDLQRQHHLAIAVVHHARKGAGNARAGQALRGSSEFHAWGDSNLYLRRKGDRICLSIEHRAAASHGGIPLRLVSNGPHAALEIDDRPPPTEPEPEETPEQRTLKVLSAAQNALGFKELRRTCHIRTSTLCEVLASLTRDGRVLKSKAGYTIVQTQSERSRT